MKTLYLLFLVLYVSALQAQTSTVQSNIDSLIIVSRSYVTEQSFEEAIKVIEIAEQLTIDDFPTLYAKCLYNHGRAHLYSAQYSKAIPYFNKSLAIQEKELGRNSADVAYSLTGLANANRELGRYEKAAPLYLESKEIRKKVFGINHPTYAGAVNNLALLHWDLGQYKEAEALLIESTDIRMQTLGKNHEDYAYSLSNLAILYDQIGAYEKAEKILLQCMKIYKEVLGTDHPVYPEALQSLATVYFNLKKYDRSEELYLECLDIWGKVYGLNDEYYMAFQANLADVYLMTNQIDKAELIFEDILKKINSNSQKNQTLYAVSLYNLGDFLFQTNKLDKVAELFEESKNTLQKETGTSHPLYALNLVGLAEIYELEQTKDGAEALLIEASKLRQAQLNNAMSYLSEKELATYTDVFEDELARIFKITQRRLQNKIPLGKLGGLCYDNLLFYKGFLLLAVQKLKAMASSTPNTVEMYNDLKAQRRILAQEYSNPISERDSLLIITLEEKANQIEKDIAKELDGYEEIKKTWTWQDIQAQLKDDEAALEFIHFSFEDENKLRKTMYAALLIEQGFETPSFIPLFEEKELIRTINSSRGINISGLYNTDARGLTPIKTIDHKDLFDLIWKPIDAELGNINTIYYAPSGLLHRISFDAIAIDNQQRLSDQYQLVRKESTRSLHILNSKKNNLDEVLLYGGITYDAFNFNNSRSVPQANEISAWSYLDGTKREITKIAELLKNKGFKVKLKSGYDASEESFKSINQSEASPRIIHVATHGYFYPSPKSTKINVQKSTMNAFESSSNPLIRSGLLFAGANQTWSQIKSDRSDQEDGILTAYEISQMDLSNTELVILSACETGRGEIRGKEGVYGLQRALKIAGVKNMIISLWKVPDAETSELMTSFYTNWIHENKSIRSSLWNAQKELRERGLAPYYWAGFVLLE